MKLNPTMIVRYVIGNRSCIQNPQPVSTPVIHFTTTDVTITKKLQMTLRSTSRDHETLSLQYFRQAGTRKFRLFANAIGISSGNISNCVPAMQPMKNNGYRLTGQKVDIMNASQGPRNGDVIPYKRNAPKNCNA